MDSAADYIQVHNEPATSDKPGPAQPSKAVEPSANPLDQKRLDARLSDRKPSLMNMDLRDLTGTGAVGSVRAVAASSLPASTAALQPPR